MNTDKQAQWESYYLAEIDTYRVVLRVWIFGKWFEWHTDISSMQICAWAHALEVLLEDAVASLTSCAKETLWSLAEQGLIEEHTSFWKLAK